MLQIVATCYKAEFSWHHISFSVVSFVNINTLRVFERFKDAFDGFIQKIFDNFVLIARNVIEIRVFKDSSEEEAPCDPFNAILTVVNLSTSDLSVYMIW